MNTKFQDKLLRCQDCGATFIFKAGEQAYYQSKQLSTPKRCQPCREHRRATLVPDSRVQ